MSDLSRGAERPGDSTPTFNPIQETALTDLAGLPTRTFREGLPPTYRMRADAHYVDQLDAPPARARLELKATAEPARRVTLAIEQDLVVVPETWLTLSPAALADADGHQLVAPMALKRIAETYGGRLVTTRLAYGTRVALELPIAVRGGRPSASP